jgi:hypothetical protein
MKWRILFGSLFVASVIMMFVYSMKPLVESNVTTKDTVIRLDHEGYPTGEGYATNPTSRIYQDNYAAIGAVIGFGIIAGASVIGFALVIREKNSS